MVKETVKRFDLSSEFFIEEGCFIIEASNSSDDEDLSIARARLEPGKRTRWHRLKRSGERYYILAGQGIVEVGDLEPQEVGPGDVVIIPAGRRQRIANTGPDDLLFLALCTPPFTMEDYEDIEELQS